MASPTDRAAERRSRYRHDPAFRSSILESNRRSRERDPNPYRERLNKMAAKICRLRDSIEFHTREVERQQKRLLLFVARRERLKAEGRKIVAMQKGGTYANPS